MDAYAEAVSGPGSESGMGLEKRENREERDFAKLRNAKSGRGKRAWIKSKIVKSNLKIYMKIPEKEEKVVMVLAGIGTFTFACPIR